MSKATKQLLAPLTIIVIFGAILLLGIILIPILFIVRLITWKHWWFGTPVLNATYRD